MKLGIYGGTFSPIHMGHILAAESFLKEFELDRLMVIPTALPPHKAEVDGASAAERLRMTELAFDGQEKVEVSNFEILRGGKSYSVNTLEQFKSGNELYMLVGTDMFLTLDEWFRPDEIFRLADIVLKRRENDSTFDELILQKSKEYADRFKARIHFINSPAFEISSTKLREMIRENRSLDGLVPKKAEEYIYANKLYKGGI